MQNLKTAIALSVLGILAIPLATGCGGVKKETFNVTILYVLEPTEELPEGLTTLAVLDAGTEVTGGEDDARAKKWAALAADGMERMIQESASKFGTGLSVAKRDATTKILAEQDLKAAGLVDTSTATQAGKLLDVQALITSKINIIVEVNKSKKTSFDLTHLAGFGGRGWGGGSAGVGAREADAISRNLTVACKFSMVDAATGETYFDYAPKPFAKHDKKTPGAFFGRSSGEGDLDALDMYIGELVETGTREFVGIFVPCEVEYAYELSSSRNESSAAGVAAMRADEYETAMQHFKTAIAEDPKDHRSAFCMGVTNELMGDWDTALKSYKQVCGVLGVDDDEMDRYLAAKNRLAAHKDRIRK